MSRMQEDIQCAGSDTRPPMLDRTDFESWQQRIRLYCLGKLINGEKYYEVHIKKDHIQMIGDDVIKVGTEVQLQQGSSTARVLKAFQAEEKERYKADIRATNILLQGIPKDIYSLINHYTDAKDIWENVKMILEGSELTKDDRESQLYDEYEHFRQIKGEGIQGYYVRFGQPNTDPLALVSDASAQQYPTQSSKSPNSTEPYPSDNFQMNSGSSSTENLMKVVTNSSCPPHSIIQITSFLKQTINRRTIVNARHKAMGSRRQSCGSRCPWKIQCVLNQGDHFQRKLRRGNGVA
ncbi:hypothetical protein Tco_1201494 [Tanacetum coccineum]